MKDKYALIGSHESSISELMEMLAQSAVMKQNS